MTELPPTSFAVISGKQVQETSPGRHARVVRIVEDAYLAHGAGRTVNPPSDFLRFPDRIIALPASINAVAATDGLKSIASVPRNVERELPRASAVLLLNEPDTGYPFAGLIARSSVNVVDDVEHRLKAGSSTAPCTTKCVLTVGYTSFPTSSTTWTDPAVPPVRPNDGQPTTQRS